MRHLLVLFVAACAPVGGSVWVSRDGAPASVDVTRLDAVTAAATDYWSARGYDVWPATSAADADIVAAWDPRVSVRLGEATDEGIRLNPREMFYLGDLGDPCDGASFDLGTVLRHELGHVLGLHDIHDVARNNEVMYLGLDWCEVRG